MAPLIEAVEAGGAQFDEAGFEGFGQRGFGSRFGGGFGRSLGGFGFGLRRDLGVAHREERIEAGSLAQRECCFGDLVHRVALDQAVAVDAINRAAAGVEQPQVVVDLGGRGDGGARVTRRVLLLDRDRRSQAVDQVHVGLLDALQELAGISRERLDVAALPLGVDGVEGQ